MKTISKRLLELTIQVQQIPAPTFHEHERACFVQDQFLEAGLSDVEMDAQSNVYGRIPGTAPGAYAPLVLSAHLDTVFPASTPLNITRDDGRVYGPGIGDNSVAVAGLLGIAWLLREKMIALPGDLWLVANVGEEGLGNLEGMKSVVERFGSRPVAYLVLEGTALGQVYHRALRVRRYKITFTTGGGHSWAHFGAPSAIHEMARFISDLAELDIPTEPRTTYNVGTVTGGTTINTIAPFATLELDLRSESPGVLNRLIEQVEKLARKRENVKVAVALEIIGDRPGGELPVDHPLVRLAEQSLEMHGLTPRLKIGSTDANIPISMQLPAVCIGITNGGGGHTTDEYILSEPLQVGMKFLLDMITQVWDALGNPPPIDKSGGAPPDHTD